MISFYLQLVFAVMTSVSCFYLLFVYVLVGRFCRRRQRAEQNVSSMLPGGAFERSQSRMWPAVSQIKPCHNLDEQTVKALATFVEQDYPAENEVIFASEESLEPVEDLARRAELRLQPTRVSMVRGTGQGFNRKIVVCQLAQAQARNDIVMLSDADMRAKPDLLRRCMQPFQDKKVGVVTSLYIVKHLSGVGTWFEGLSVTDFAASVLAAQQVEGIKFAMGAVMAVRSQALAEFGGLDSLKDYLADDYQLGYRASQHGWEVVLADTVVEDVLDPISFADYWSHQLRWMRTYRICRPGGFFSYMVTQGLLWSLGFVVATGFSWHGWAVLAAWLLVRTVWAYQVWNKLSERAPAASAALVAGFKDLCYLLLWVLSFTGNVVRWGTKDYRVRPDGTMELVDK